MPIANVEEATATATATPLDLCKSTTMAPTVTTLVNPPGGLWPTGSHNSDIGLQAAITLVVAYRQS